MTGEKDRQEEASGRQAGPNVAKSDKKTIGYSKRVILVFIIGDEIDEQNEQYPANNHNPPRKTHGNFRPERHCIPVSVFLGRGFVNVSCGDT